MFTHGGMYMDLKELLGREIDLVVDGTLRPYAAERANRDKKLIYERKSAGDKGRLEKDSEVHRRRRTSLRLSRLEM